MSCFRIGEEQQENCENRPFQTKISGQVARRRISELLNKSKRKTTKVGNRVKVVFRLSLRKVKRKSFSHKSSPRLTLKTT